MIHDIYKAYKSSTGMSTDSRKIATGNIFFALKGPSFNGNDFIPEVLKSGAAFAVADEVREGYEEDDRIFIADDALDMLQDLARHHRHKLKIPVIGLTGSNGKTTSKELLFSVLSQHYRTYATHGNLNNHIGVPLSVLEIKDEHEIAIIEMGANHQKEIKFLCTISRPEYGYITNIGLAHLEGFGGEEGVYIGKKELYDHLRNTNGKLFINADDPKVVRATAGASGITYGADPEAQFQGEGRIENDRLSVRWWRKHDASSAFEVHTQLSGSYNFSNVMSAVAVGSYFGVPDHKINAGLEAYTPTNNRSQVEQTERGNTVIVDCYNANPSSMLAAIENLDRHEQQLKLAIVGDMYELGDQSKVKHTETIDRLIELGIPTLAVGKFFGAVEVEHELLTYLPSTDAAKDHLSANPPQGTLILLKGSRTMKLEQLLELL